MGFEKKIDENDFTVLVDTLDTKTFCVEMHKRIVRETELLINERGTYDLKDVTRVMANYPRYYSWIIVESEVMNEMLGKTEMAFDSWYKALYQKASRQVTGRATIASIEAKVAEIGDDEKFEAIEDFKTSGMDDKDIKEKTKYMGLSGRRKYIIELKSKVAMAKGMVKVWSTAINALQSLSRNIGIEMEIVKRNMVD